MSNLFLDSQDVIGDAATGSGGGIVNTLAPQSAGAANQEMLYGDNDVPLNLPTIRIWDITDNSTHYDKMIAAPSDRDMYFMWVFWSLIMAIVAVVTGFIFIAIIKEPKARKNPFNVYLLGLMAPDFLMSALCFGTCWINAATGHFHSVGLCYAQSFYFIFGIGANSWLNALIAQQLHRMLWAAHLFQPIETPPLKRVLWGIFGVYTWAAFVASWGLLDLPWLPHHTQLVLGTACIPMDQDTASTIFFYCAFFPALMGAPLIYVVYVLYSIYKYDLMPAQGKRRILAVYFLRLAVVFVVMWLPALLFLFVLGPWVNHWVAWAGGAWSHLQGLVSSLLSLCKPDVKRATQKLTNQTMPCISHWFFDTDAPYMDSQQDETTKRNNHDDDERAQRLHTSNNAMAGSEDNDDPLASVGIANPSILGRLFGVLGRKRESSSSSNSSNRRRRRRREGTSSYEAAVDHFQAVMGRLYGGKTHKTASNDNSGTTTTTTRDTAAAATTTSNSPFVWNVIQQSNTTTTTTKAATTNPNMATRSNSSKRPSLKEGSSALEVIMEVRDSYCSTFSHESTLGGDQKDDDDEEQGNNTKRKSIESVANLTLATTAEDDTEEDDSNNNENDEKKVATMDADVSLQDYSVPMAPLETKDYNSDQAPSFWRSNPSSGLRPPPPAATVSNASSSSFWRNNTTNSTNSTSLSSTSGHKPRRGSASVFRISVPQKSEVDIPAGESQAESIAPSSLQKDKLEDISLHQEKSHGASFASVDMVGTIR